MRIAVTAITLLIIENLFHTNVENLLINVAND